LIYRPVIDFKNAGFIYALLVGATLVGGLYTFYMALSSGKASIVVPLTALYPIVTVVLSFLILKESITLTQGLGVVLAIVSIILLSM
jgi:transporter family protein